MGKIQKSDLSDIRAKLSESRAQKQTWLKRLHTGEITLNDFIRVSETDDLDSLRKVRLITILAGLSTWNKESATRALVSYGIPVNMTLNVAQQSPRIIKIMSSLVESSATRWQQRVSAPPGWPWFGNVLSTLKELEDTTLPEELRESTRFIPTAEKKTLQDSYVDKLVMLLDSEDGGDDQTSPRKHPDETSPAEEDDDLSFMDDYL